MGMSSTDDGRISKSERRFLEGKTDEVPAGVLTGHEKWLIADADPDAAWEWARKKWGLLDIDRELYGMEEIRRFVVEEARLRLSRRFLAEQRRRVTNQACPACHATGAGDDDDDRLTLDEDGLIDCQRCGSTFLLESMIVEARVQVSERTWQRRMKQNSDLFKQLINKRTPGRPLSDKGADERLRAMWTFETGKWNRTCPICGTAFQAKRSDATFCSPTCRKRKQQGSTTRWRWAPGTPGSPYTRNDNNRDA